jgi:hypothetical protein
MTTRPDAATRHVVERCPRCGVEHGVSVDSVCEACHAPLRHWCRVHGRETGWLDAPACIRCARETVQPRSAPSTRMPCPAPATPSSVSPAAPVSAGPAAADMARAAEKPLGMAGHLFVMLLMMLMATGGSTLLGVIGGFVYVLFGYGVIPDTPIWFALIGAIVGLVAGGSACWDYVKHLPAPPAKP